MGKCKLFALLSSINIQQKNYSAHQEKSGAQQHKKPQARKTRHKEKNNDRMIVERQRKGVKLSMMKKRDVST